MTSVAIYSGFLLYLASSMTLLSMVRLLLVDLPFIKPKLLPLGMLCLLILLLSLSVRIDVNSFRVEFSNVMGRSLLGSPLKKSYFNHFLFKT